MTRSFLSSALLLIYIGVTAQAVSLEKGWKFRQGDSLAWMAPALDETGWKDISIDHPWEKQGYANYDGFGWYRLHVTVPSSLKNTSYLKDSIRIALGMLD